ncbi:hypothetical protein S14_108 [Shewanella sp. phage 1/4]|uniref:hypothetical protein n=1 Tax=Shewanella phage 1/4 TaxID=1458859 RepID=UPI0004F7D88A|nr:hypothetical protein S14_108 [Shewanella sp. phage 1/4]AHK11217.1 hypothetical protein S14_108 [Shewanella sp. phage 1/4]
MGVSFDSSACDVNDTKTNNAAAMNFILLTPIKKRLFTYSRFFGFVKLPVAITAY